MHRHKHFVILNQGSNSQQTNLTCLSRSLRIEPIYQQMDPRGVGNRKPLQTTDVNAIPQQTKPCPVRLLLEA